MGRLSPVPVFENGYGAIKTIGRPAEDDWHEVKDSEKIKLSEVLNKIKQKYVYIYHFGDDWIHNITVEKIEDIESSRADCIAGSGACPPEDCGGPWGYAELKNILANRRHREYKERREWLGLQKNEKWDAAAFSVEETRADVSKIR